MPRRPGIRSPPTNPVGGSSHASLQTRIAARTPQNTSADSRPGLDADGDRAGRTRSSRCRGRTGGGHHPVQGGRRGLPLLPHPRARHHALGRPAGVRRGAGGHLQRHRAQRHRDAEVHGRRPELGAAEGGRGRRRRGRAREPGAGRGRGDRAGVAAVRDRPLERYAGRAGPWSPEPARGAQRGRRRGLGGGRPAPPPEAGGPGLDLDGPRPRHPARPGAAPGQAGRPGRLHDHGRPGGRPAVRQRRRRTDLVPGCPGGGRPGHRPAFPAELSVAETTGGGVYVNARSSARCGTENHRMATTSTDSGATFDAPFSPVPGLDTPPVSGSLLRLHAKELGAAQDRLLFSAPPGSAPTRWRTAGSWRSAPRTTRGAPGRRRARS